MRESVAGNLGVRAEPTGLSLDTQHHANTL